MALTDKLTAIANALRAKTGKTAPLTLDEMAFTIDSNLNQVIFSTEEIEEGSISPYSEGTLYIVYDVALISFTIADIVYQAEEGMTWEEWVNSSYNTSGFIITDSRIKATNGKFIICNNTNNYANSSATIENNLTYTLARGTN